MMLRTICFFLLSSCCWSLFASPQVLVSIKPLQLLVTSLTEGEVNADYLVAPQFSPHDYALRPSDIRKLKQADLVIWVGEELEPFLSKPLANHTALRQISLLDIPQMPLIETGEEHDHAHHDHGHDHQIDPHLWLGFDTSLIAAQVISEQLSQLNPAQSEHYRQQLQRFTQRLSDQEKQLSQALKPYQKQGYFVFHDGYSYFERSFGLNRLGQFTINPQQRPGARSLSQIRQQIAEQDVQCIFAEPQFDGAILESVSRETGAYIGQLDPLAIEVENNADAFFTMFTAMSNAYIDCLKR